MRSHGGDVCPPTLPNIWRTEFEIYLKHAPQRDFSVIQDGESNFKVRLEPVWHTARLRKNGQTDFRLKVFVYLLRLQRAATLRRATAVH